MFFEMYDVLDCFDWFLQNWLKVQGVEYQYFCEKVGMVDMMMFMFIEVLGLGVFEFL